MHHLQPFFRKFLGGVPQNPLSKQISLTQPYCSTAAYIAPRLVYDPVLYGRWFSFSINHWLCAFLVQFYKRYSLVWVRFALQIAPFCFIFSKFSLGRPPNPHIQEGRPLSYPPPLGPSGLETPRLASGSATGLQTKEGQMRSEFCLVGLSNSETPSTSIVWPSDHRADDRSCA